MYVPAYFRESDDRRIREFLEANEFVTVVSSEGDRPIASHLLVEVREAPSGALLLAGHMARANPLWRTFTMRPEVLVIVLGAHTYISPTWYHVPSVPTWNYTAVHLYGRPRIIENRDELRGLLTRLVERHERAEGAAEPFDLGALSDKLVDQMMNAIVGFEIEVSDIEAASKMSQNQSAEDHRTIVARLRERADDDSRSVAGEMTRIRGEQSSER